MTDASICRLNTLSSLAGVEAIGANLALLSFADSSLSSESNARVRKAGLQLLTSPVLLSRLTSAPFLTVSRLEHSSEHQASECPCYTCTMHCQQVMFVSAGGGVGAAGKQCDV